MPKLWGRFCIATLRLCCGVRLDVTGVENLPAGGCIIAAQHQSALDIFIWLAILPRPALVFKKELARIPVLGPMLEPAGMIPIDRAGGAGALRKLIADCNVALADNRQIVIFPEGTRNAPGTRGTLQPGIVALAKATAAAIIPAATDSGRRWASGAFRKTPGPVAIIIKPALIQKLNRQEITTALSKVFYEQ